MNLKFLFLLLLIAFGAGFWFAFQYPLQTGFSSLASASVPVAGPVVPFFCPVDSCGQQLVQRIDSAQKTIDVAIYSFTLGSVSDALIAAHGRGVQIRVLFDAGQAASKYSQDEKLAKADISIKRLDLQKGILHDKYIVIDNQLVGTGSFNYSENASHYNKENLVFIDDTKIAQQFESDFEELWNES